VYCGGKPDGLDHIVSRVRGGRDTWENRAPACRTCDHEKGDMPLIWFLLARQTVERRTATRAYDSEKGRRDARRHMLGAWQRRRQAAEKQAPETTQRRDRRLTWTLSETHAADLEQA
jgi:hypothetical protein